MAQFGRFCIDFHAVTKRSETACFGSNGVDRVRSLRKIPMRLCLANLCDNRLSCSIEMVQNTTKHEFWVQWNGSGLFVVKNSDATLFSELVRSWHKVGQFALTFVQ
jgi:hypothetical protein